MANTVKSSEKEPDELSPQAYLELLTKLVQDGAIYGKTENVAAYRIPNISIVTQNAAGEDEVRKNLDFKENLYLVFDRKFWPTAFSRQLAVREVARKWAERTIGEEDLNHPDFRGPGLWTSKTSGFEFDYTRDTENVEEHDIYKPNPEGRRQCIAVHETMKIPTKWGEKFLIPAEGTLAIRSRDIPGLTAALDKIKKGQAAVEDALYNVESDGNRVAAFDVYGMMPHFLDENYKIVGHANGLRLVESEILAPHHEAKGPVQQDVPKTNILDKMIFIPFSPVYRSLLAIGGTTQENEKRKSDFFDAIKSLGVEPSENTDWHDVEGPKHIEPTCHQAWIGGSFHGHACVHETGMERLLEKKPDLFVFKARENEDDKDDRVLYEAQTQWTPERISEFKKMITPALQNLEEQAKAKHGHVSRYSSMHFDPDSGKVLCGSNVFDELQRLDKDTAFLPTAYPWGRAKKPETGLFSKAVRHVGKIISLNRHDEKINP